MEVVFSIIAGIVLVMFYQYFRGISMSKIDEFTDFRFENYVNKHVKNGFADEKEFSKMIDSLCEFSRIEKLNPLKASRFIGNTELMLNQYVDSPQREKLLRLTRAEIANVMSKSTIFS